MALITPTIPPPAANSTVANGDIASFRVGPLLAQAIERGREIASELNMPGIVSNIKIVAIVATVVFGVILIYIFVKIRRFVASQMLTATKSLAPPENAVGAYDARWREIKKHADSFNPAEWKFAIVEADKLADDALRAAGFKGETMGEMLTLITRDQIPEIQNLWEAHKLRNRLVHEANYELGHNEAIAAVEVFERVLAELGSLSKSRQ